MTRILVANRDATLVEEMKEHLAGSGYRVTSATDGRRALSLFQTSRPDLLLVDMDLPSLNGLDLCRQIRSYCASPIILTFMKEDEEKRALGFKAGADSILSWPFTQRELCSRIRTVFHRQAIDKGLAQHPGLIRVGAITVNRLSRQVYRSQQVVHLSSREFDLLSFLMMYPGCSFSQEEIEYAVWGRSTNDQAMPFSDYFACLRMRIENDFANPQYLLSCSDGRYRFVSENELSARQPSLWRAAFLL